MMKLSLKDYRVVARIFWILAVVATVVWALVPGYEAGWDLRVYEAALLSLRAGHDPYADGIAIQRAFHATLAQHPDAPTPFTYVYSPLTLWIVRLVSHWPIGLTATLYWAVYVVMALAAIWVGMRLVKHGERPVFGLLAPAAVFFPGLLQQDVLFCGNIAIILFGLVLLAAYRGWTRQHWGLFYVTALAASCCKAQLLCVLVIPGLSAQRQWLRASATGAVGVALFAMQPYLWPTLFRHYLEAVDLQFSFNRDFSSSPAGLVANALFYRLPYKVVSPLAYLAYAIPVFLVMFWLSRRYLAGVLTLKEWAPVLLVGTVLMNPRIMEYDVLPMTIPMALVAWRTFARGKTHGQTVLRMAIFFIAANVSAQFAWRFTEGVLLLGLFAAGSITLYRDIRERQAVARDGLRPDRVAAYQL